MGPVAVRAHLAPYLPGVVNEQGKLPGEAKVGPVSAAPFGSAGILPIPFVYISLMGADGLRRATEVAILNANYVATRLRDHYPVLYAGRNGRVAHECILDVRPLKETSGISAEDIAKRLMDYGFHAPTMSFPVAGTLMVEPTESESQAELDRFVDAMISIREEIAQVERGERDREDNVLKNAPHTAQMLLAEEWLHDYPRQQAAYRWPRCATASTGRPWLASTTPMATAIWSAPACRSKPTPEAHDGRAARRGRCAGGRKPWFLEPGFLSRPRDVQESGVRRGRAGRS